ncbi:hypothetical protein MMC07_006414 [Pseudocyphellaria aurata]|nr:hypothetical protein [Pseudocyphellaria aurata]
MHSLFRRLKFRQPTIPVYPLSPRPYFHRLLSTTSTSHSSSTNPNGKSLLSSTSPSLPHLTASSAIHVVPITDKSITQRSALAVGHIIFSNPTPSSLVRAHALKKGDVLAVARVAAIMAVKNTSDLIPLCHSGVPVEGISVNVDVVGGHDDGVDDAAARSTPESQAYQSTTIPRSPEPEQEPFSTHQQAPQLSPLPPYGGVRISVFVKTTAKTGIEMEALAGVVGAGLTIIDMCKSVDRGLRMEGVRVVGKRGGRSGDWGGIPEG